MPTASRTCSDQGVSVPTAARSVFARSRKNITPVHRAPAARVFGVQSTGARLGLHRQLSTEGDEPKVLSPQALVGRQRHFPLTYST